MQPPEMILFIKRIVRNIMLNNEPKHVADDIHLVNEPGGNERMEVGNVFQTMLFSETARRKML
jgi:hypothetical protein